MSNASVTRMYYHGDVISNRLYDVARVLPKVTVDQTFSYGGPNGTWKGSPFEEIKSRPASVPGEIVALASSPIPRPISREEAIPKLFEEVKQSIRDRWNPEAFHLVFHSSGYDSRIISAAIGQLMEEMGQAWEGKGLLFLSNRWESAQFYGVMEAQGWGSHRYVAYDEGSPEEHFTRGLKEVWKDAPLPIPGNMWQYLVSWAEERGMVPQSDVQVFTGLWANEAWNCFLSDANPWLYRVGSWYGYNTMATLPVKGQWVEYPMVSDGVLSLLSRTKVCDGDGLRKDVSEYACPEAARIPRLGLDERKHPLDPGLLQRLDLEYRKTWLGSRVSWSSPGTSEFSDDWGRYSLSMLIEKLVEEGVSVC